MTAHFCLGHSSSLILELTDKSVFYHFNEVLSVCLYSVL